MSFEVDAPRIVWCSGCHTSPPLACEATTTTT
jgi:hypothetical protein